VQLLQQRMMNGDFGMRSDWTTWGEENGVYRRGQIVAAEVSPTLRCSEACAGCPDNRLELQKRIQADTEPKVEVVIPKEEMLDRITHLADLGVHHVMFIGGTIDHLHSLPALVDHTLNLGKDMRVSWFTDMIPQIDERGELTKLFQRNLEHGWIKKVATHVSMDYPYEGDPTASEIRLPPKKGRMEKHESDPEYSRLFKSQYGAIGARRLIENGVRRVVINTTISSRNVDQIMAIYRQVGQLQEYAQSIGSATEVMWTFSPWIWRPHQARGDGADQSPFANGIQDYQMDEVNLVFGSILDDTYRRIHAGEQRILANSSGYTALMASGDSKNRKIVVEQDVPYKQGNAEMLAVQPDGSIRLDPMFVGPELIVPFGSTFGYRDRDPRQNHNLFSQFSDPSRYWFPNLVTT